MGWAWLIAIALLIWSPLYGGIFLLLAVLYVLLTRYGPTLEVWKANQEAQAKERAQAKLAMLEAEIARHEAETARHKAELATLDAQDALLHARIAEWKKNGIDPTPLIDARIAALDALIAEDRKNGTLAADPEYDARIAELDARAAELDAKIAALDAERRKPLEADAAEAEREEILRSLEELKAELLAKNRPN